MCYYYKKRHFIRECPAHRKKREEKASVSTTIRSDADGSDSDIGIFNLYFIFREYMFDD